ncbi:MAG TPA: HAMP domain-containing sensor histidine kinase [Oligoflexia bacterium]|nr:HAMP domain-containing sensor histidine kinase [Oligoflexia bacterium]HMR25670.1 HAMP domain-containing sensor histidine kinase [Oligoflexia bacterium]
MKQNFSLRRRFLYLSSALLLALIFMSTFVLERVYHETQLNSQKQNATTLLNLLIASTELGSKNIFQVDIEKLPESFFNGDVIALIQESTSNQIVWQSSSANLAHLPKSTLGLGEVFFKKLKPFSQTKRFIASLPMQWQIDEQNSFDITFTVLQDGQSFLKQQTFFRIRAIIAILILGCLFIILQYIFVNTGFTPIQKIEHAIHLIRQGKKSQLDDKAIPNELEPMIQSLNLLLDHQKNLNHSSKQAADDLAHSLKTPLTALKSQIELLEESSSSQKKHLKELIDNANGLIERKLSLLKQQHQSVFINTIELKPIIERVAMALQKSSSNDIHFQLLMDEHLQYAIHPDDLYELMGNLLENAFKYAKQQVSVEATIVNQSLKLSIHDDGDGFSTSTPMQLLARGKRLDEQSSGTGLGLYISEQIVLRYKGKINLHNDNGANIIINLPL